MLKQQAAPSLPRVLGLFGAVMLTLSCITPTSSLFIIVPEVLAGQGSGAVIALVAGLVVSVGIAFCYAELGTLAPSSGGEYAMVTTLLGRFAGWLTFGLSAVLLIIIPPIIALGTADYLSDLFAVDRSLAGAVVMLLATLFAVLDVRSNAFITGVFLAIEVVAAMVVAGLGFAHAQRDVSVLVSPVVPDGQGGLSAFSLAILMAGLTVTMFSFNGFGSAVYLTEEIKQPRRNVPRTVFWALGLAGVVIIVPTAAAVLGVGSLGDLVDGTFPDYVRAWAGPGFAVFINLGIAIAILNAVLVMALQNGRVIFASGRDRAWPEPVNRALTRLHPRWGSPWVSTLAIGLPGALMAALFDIEGLLGVTSVVLTVVSLLIAVAALRARSAGHREVAAWRMPLWPAIPVAVVAALAYALAEQSWVDLAIAGVIVALFTAYYLLYLRPRPLTRWVVTTTED
ncbi:MULTISPECIES: APC family permease [Streptosporangium]|uniref:Amino acid transporter n=1 Tax=Streptosporangium brasiliense TaxID=47480 RepID=A0ABT9QW41_9ACTN|nr:APC family permease [Streptosporangium brasiliense]MDP9861208.1 amino acid transporter [Streptosporangium brasiliense]